MFKVGDEVVCVNISDDDKYNDCVLAHKLNLYNKYKVLGMLTDRYSSHKYIVLKELDYYIFEPTRFKLLSEIRKEKLNKLLNV